LANIFSSKNVKNVLLNSHVNIQDLTPLFFTHVDICAANAAGMIGIGVLSGLDDRQTLWGENPHMILSGVEELIDIF